MTTIERRHSRWYEQIVLSPPFQIIAGLCFVLLLPAIWEWGYSFLGKLNDVRINTLFILGCAFVVISFILRRLSLYMSGGIFAHIVPVVTVVYLITFAILFFTRSSYSRPVLLYSYFFCLLWCFIAYFVGRRYRRRKFALLPMDNCGDLKSSSSIELRQLHHPDLEGVRYDAIIADLRSHKMSAEWERFIAQCILSHIPVYHIQQVLEGYTGRVQLDHLSENNVGTLIPSPLYSAIKRLIDIFAVVLTLPLSLVLMLFTAIAIKLDSPGPVLFIQNRVGLGNRDFKIYKFRSMRVDAESEGAKFAANNDSRITRVGHFIRKTRLDELPQLFNVLIGDMSLIGPRPEQRIFVDQFENEIPFYIYRHVVRPGITGWAQVTQGYAGDADATRIKIQHDFYYIKHFSFWLDILIVFKTIRVLLTGWGAR